jgi:hypothetical protein
LLGELSAHFRPSDLHDLCAMPLPLRDVGKGTKVAWIDVNENERRSSELNRMSQSCGVGLERQFKKTTVLIDQLPSANLLKLFESREIEVKSASGRVEAHRIRCGSLTK